MGIDRLFFAVSAFPALVLLAGGFLLYPLPRRFYHTLIKRKAPPGTSCSASGLAGTEAGGGNRLDTQNCGDVFIRAEGFNTQEPAHRFAGELQGEVVDSQDGLRLHAYCVASGTGTDPAEYERRIRNFLDKYLDKYMGPS
jgi:hypothetical protein